MRRIVANVVGIGQMPSMPSTSMFSDKAVKDVVEEIGIILMLKRLSPGMHRIGTRADDLLSRPGSPIVHRLHKGEEDKEGRRTRTRIRDHLKIKFLHYRKRPGVLLDLQQLSRPTVRQNSSCAL